MKDLYINLKRKHQEEINDFTGIFFAFNNDQFEEGMKKVELELTDTAKIYSIGGGGYMRKDRSSSFGEMLKRHDIERKQMNRDKKALFEAIVYELGNHEYCITGDVTDALEAVGIAEKDLPTEILAKAKKEALKMVAF